MNEVEHVVEKEVEHEVEHVAEPEVEQKVEQEVEQKVEQEVEQEVEGKAAEPYQSGWMLNQTLSVDLKKQDDEYLKELNKTFFEELVNHRFTEERLFWLYQWIGTEQRNEKIYFLMQLWTRDYFDPFSSPDTTAKKIENDWNRGLRNRYTVSLSSTKPGMIRITFTSMLRGGIVHRRISTGSESLNEHPEEHYNTDPIYFNVIQLEEEIKMIMQRHGNSILNSFVYVPYKPTYEYSKSSPLPYQSSE
jgi:hypothetical protein